MMGYYGWNTYRPMLAFGWVFGLIFWILVVFVVVGLIKWFVKSGRDKEEIDGEDNIGSPLDILKKRYAKGEITKKEFLDMKKDIS